MAYCLIVIPEAVGPCGTRDDVAVIRWDAPKEGMMGVNIFEKAAIGHGQRNNQEENFC